MSKKAKMGFNATWSMAVGGMVGGGIFSVLGVIVHTAAQWAWLSFVIAGLIALIAAHSYSQLAKKFGESGGAFTFLREIDHAGFAGSLSWILILGYILTISVYGFTFGHYVANIFSFGAWFPRLLALAVIGILTIVNLRGVSDASNVEIITVWGKLAVLLGLAVFGLVHWAPEKLSEGIESQGISEALIGAATIFMAYEGFQLLSYDYDDISQPGTTLPLASITAVIAVIIIYVMVALGATMLVGASTIVEKEEVALAVAGKVALGTPGLVIVTIAAAFSTISAINATLFSTGRLMESVAQKKDLPNLLAKENSNAIPYYSILIIAGFAALLASIGSLGSLVEAASLIFLFTFGTVCFIAYQERVRLYRISLLGTIGSAMAIGLSVWRLAQHDPVSLSVIAGLVLLTMIGRPFLLRNCKKQN